MFLGWSLFYSSAFWPINFWNRVNLLLTVHLLVLNMLVLICSVYPMQKQFSERVSPKLFGQHFMDKKWYQDALLVSFTANPPIITTANHTGEKYLLHPQSYVRVLSQSHSHHLVFHTGKSMMLKWNNGHWNLNKNIFWSSEKHRKHFSNINDCVKSDIKKWILYHTHVIQYPIENYYIKAKLDH